MVWMGSSCPSAPPRNFIFFFTDAATTEIYTLSLHDALPISLVALDGRNAARFEGSFHIFDDGEPGEDRKSTRLNSSHITISYAVFCLKKKSNDQPALRIELDLVNPNDAGLRSSDQRSGLYVA